MRTVLLDADIIVCDTETTKTSVWTDRYMIGVGFYCGIKGREPHTIGFYLPFRHDHDPALFDSVSNLPIEWIRELAPVLEREDVAWIFHNAAFDLNILQNEKLEVPGEIRDTQVIAHLLDENHFSYELDSLARIYLGERKLNPSLKILEKNLDGWDKIPPDAMGRYCEVDCELTYDLHNYLWPKLVEDEELYQLWTDDLGSRTYVKTLASTMRPGVVLDVKEAERLSHESLERMHVIRQSLGFDPAKASQIAHTLHGSLESGGLGITPVTLSKYKPALGKRGTAEFPNGLPSTDSDHLEYYALKNPAARSIVEQVLEFRRLQKAESTWYTGFRALVGPDRRLHPGLKQHGTVTGRLSSSKPNMQQIPRNVEKTPVKKLFLAPAGYELWEFDYSQLELRLATVYAGQENMKDAYREGADVHHITAEGLGLFSQSNLDYDTARYVGKTSNFLLIYLGSGERLQATLWTEGRLLLPISDCEEWKENFHSLYPNFSATARQATYAATTKGFVRMWNGRRRRFPDRSGAGSAFNSLIQGGAGQIVMTSMNMIAAEKFEKIQMVNQVHDSIWFYIKKSVSEPARERIAELMEWPTKEFGIPFPVEGKCLAVGE